MITFGWEGGGIIGNGLFRAPKKKVRCIIEIRIPPSCLVIDTIRNKEMEQNGIIIKKRYDKRKKERRKGKTQGYHNASILP